jgi:Mn-dependent DtxR family transcriptional regulator
MSRDDGDSATRDIASRMAASSSVVGNQRARLIDAGIVEPAGHGVVRYAIPGLREYLRSLPQ